MAKGHRDWFLNMAGDDEVTSVNPEQPNEARPRKERHRPRSGDDTPVLPAVKEGGTGDTGYPDRPDPSDARHEVWTLVERAQQGEAAAFGLIYDRYVDTVFRTNAVDDLNLTGTTASGTSIQRVDDTDDDDKADWTTGAGAASSWGAANAGQSPF